MVLSPETPLPKRNGCFLAYRRKVSTNANGVLLDGTRLVLHESAFPSRQFVQVDGLPVLDELLGRLLELQS